ncbi:MAG: hypothetical protein WBW37_05345, partial [Methyloceanibacter sp.]
MTEVAVPRQMFADILMLIARLRRRMKGLRDLKARTAMGEVRLDEGKATSSGAAGRQAVAAARLLSTVADEIRCRRRPKARLWPLALPRIRGMSVTLPRPKGSMILAPHPFDTDRVSACVPWR